MVAKPVWAGRVEWMAQPRALVSSVAVISPCTVPVALHIHSLGSNAIVTWPGLTAVISMPKGSRNGGGGSSPFMAPSNSSRPLRCTARCASAEGSAPSARISSVMQA